MNAEGNLNVKIITIVLIILMSASTFTTMTSQALFCATVRGDQRSEKDASFSARSMMSFMERPAVASRTYCARPLPFAFAALAPS